MYHNRDFLFVECLVKSYDCIGILGFKDFLSISCRGIELIPRTKIPYSYGFKQIEGENSLESRLGEINTSFQVSGSKERLFYLGIMDSEKFEDVISYGIELGLINKSEK